jgi:hypothetical protein
MDRLIENYDALCVSLVRGVEPVEAVQQLTRNGARPFATRQEAEGWAWNSGDPNVRIFLAAGQIGDWTFLWEDNGYEGAYAAERLSADSAFVSVYWNVNMLEQFTYARHGHIVRLFDPILDRDGGGTGEALPNEAGLDWEEQPEESMLHLQSSITGVPVANPAWLDLPGVTFWGFTE